jgi:hypothetical protein
MMIEVVIAAALLAAQGAGGLATEFKSPIAIAGVSQEKPFAFTPNGSIPSRSDAALAARQAKRPGNRATFPAVLVVSA